MLYDLAILDQPENVDAGLLLIRPYRWQGITTRSSSPITRLKVNDLPGYSRAMGSN